MAPPTLDKLPTDISNAENLPSIPGVAMEVLRLSRDANSELEDYAEAIARDPALSAKLLKLSNSSMFSLTHNVTSMRQATMVLGMKTIQLMSLSFSLTRSAASSQVTGDFDFGEFWLRSLIASVSGRGFSKLLGIQMGDEAFMCGLLSNIGQLVMNQCIPEHYAEVIAESDGWPSREAEEKILGYSHSDLGGVLLADWELPALICDTITYMHQPEELPEETDESTRELVTVMHLATLAVKILRNDQKGEPLAELIELLGKRGISPEQVTHFLSHLDGGIRETADLLELKVMSTAKLSEVIEEAREQMIRVSLGQAASLEQNRRELESLTNENRALAKQASTDKLTGLANRAGFDAILEKEINRRIAKDEPNALGLLLIDIDKFKSFNDSYGHQAGDEVLRVVGSVMNRLTRDSDLPARYGGEEFAVIVPRTTPFALGCYAERIRNEIEAAAVEVHGKQLNVTISIGGVCLSRASECDSATEAMIAAADSLLYYCKANGRNRSEIQSAILDLRTAR